MMAEAHGEAEYFPTLSKAGQAMLQHMREHPHAPVFRNQSGNKLTAADLAEVNAYDAALRERKVDWHRREPDWLAAFIERCYAQVPAYRASGPAPRKLAFMPPVSRANFSRDITRYVPEDLPLDRLIMFSTSGTTGHPLIVPSHPLVAARYLTFHRRALRRIGIELEAKTGEVAVILAGYQERCFTYTSVVAQQNEAGLAKINLHPNDWRDAQDRGLFLDAMKLEIITGDPLSFAELLKVDFAWKPRALMSTSMMLPGTMREQLEARFACPVLDLYSMNEAGPIAVFDAAVGGYVCLQPELLIETLDSEGLPTAAGELGEITLTGGFNFCLPLLRYRTGDFACLDCSGEEPVLRDFLGRAAVRFRTSDGQWINNLEVTHCLLDLALPCWRVHQGADGAIVATHGGSAHLNAVIGQRLQQLFGPKIEITVTISSENASKPQYTSDLIDATP